jgi:N-acetylglucosaminyl-diphospho-decaprenol L-rhamnosyltransferase
MKNYTVTFATLNCIDYTKKCLESLLESGVEASRIVVVDNASSDGTPEYLMKQELGGLILNRQNLSCGAAWNQGLLAQQSDWTIVMNNDIVVAPDFAQRLIEFASSNSLKLVSPARIEGADDFFDFQHFAKHAQNNTAKAIRWGSSNAICMCIHWSLFNQIGFFRANPSLLGFEDGLFYNEVVRHGIAHATTGSVWIHHIGKVTQEHLKKSRGIQSKHELVKFNDRKLYGQSWFERKLHRYNLNRSKKIWREKELSEYGMTLQGNLINHEFFWL